MQMHIVDKWQRVLRNEANGKVPKAFPQMATWGSQSESIPLEPHIKMPNLKWQ